MKSLAIASFVLGAGAVFACSGDPAEPPYVPPPATGGTGGSSATGGTAGTTGGVGGMTGGTGGVGGSAGTTGGVGGSAGTTGGVGGSAGTTGGVGGSAGATGGSAGTGQAGTGNAAGMSGAGGSAGTGQAGASGAGGTAGTGQGGMSGAGGTAGAGAGMAGMGGGGNGIPTVTELVGKLDGHLIITPCADQPNGDDCDGGGWRSNAVDNGANHACSGGRLEALIPFDVGGTPGTEYDVLMHFYGIMEPRQYSNVMREAGGATNRNGQTPTGWAEAAGNASVYSAGDNNYNTYEMHVYDQNGMRVRQYFMNSDAGTGHYTLLTNFEKTVTIIGGGEVRLRIADANCRQIKNCGANGGTGAACSTNARSVDITAAMPQPTGMPMLQQPGLGLPAQHSGQWWFIDVKTVALGN
jgi:hypothetical protein